MKCIGMNQFKYPEANKKPEITPQRCPTKLTPGIRTDINMRYVKAYHFLGTENNPKILFNKNRKKGFYERFSFWTTNESVVRREKITPEKPAADEYKNDFEKFYFPHLD